MSNIDREKLITHLLAAPEAPDYKPVADSCDALLRAVMSELGIRPDQDPVIEARQIAAALSAVPVEGEVKKHEWCGVLCALKHSKGVTP